MSFLEELKRRNVLRVATAYIVSAWLIIQVVETVLPPFGFTENAFRTTVLVLAVGFFPAIILAWIFEWTPGGVVRDDGTDRPATGGRTFDRAIIVVLMLGIVYFAIDKFLLRVEPTDFYGDRSIAVLPFDNMSSDPEQVFFADGVTEEVLNLLAGIRSLRVTNPSSAFAFRDRDQTEKEIAASLTVGYLLTGTVRRAGDRVRVRAQLFDGGADAIRWSKVYEREVDDVFLIQDEIAADVVRNLRLTLSEPLRQSQQVDPEALALVQQAKHLVETLDFEDEEYIYGLLDRAIELEPNYVDAYKLGVILSWHQTNDGNISEAARTERVETALEQIRLFDPDNAYLDAMQGWDALLNNRWEDAGTHFSLMLEKDLNDSLHLRWAANFAERLERYDIAAKLYRHAVAVDPLCHQCRRHFSRALLYARDYAEAITVRERYIQSARGGIPDYATMLMKSGRADEVYGLFQEFDANPTDVISLAFLGMAEFELGKSEAAEERLSELIGRVETQHVEPGMSPREVKYMTASLAAWMGKIDIAFDLLLEVAASEYWWAHRELGDPRWDSMRTDPRWGEYLTALGMSPARMAAIEFDPWLPE